MPRETFSISLDSPVNALVTNRESNQVAVAGRNVFKIFQINDDQNMFVESMNLRVGKNLNLNYSSADVAWNYLDDNTLATAATNGAVVIWNLQKVGRSKVEHVFQSHKRTVNRVCFHPTEPHLLLSGSQDGTMKLFDLRKKEPSVEFNSQSESVRDVQFSPFHDSNDFAAVQENGNVQLWDSRRNDRYHRQFTAHSGPVFSCDFHPEDKRYLATAGRDRSIKVWDLGHSGTPVVETCIQTIASVGQIRWRPQRKYNIASCALVFDFSLYVWDIGRPFVPFAAFTEHKDVTTGFAWRNDPHTIISTGKDGVLYQHVFTDAYRPADHVNPSGLAINSHGDICHAISDLIYKSGSTSATSSVLSQSSIANVGNILFPTASTIASHLPATLRPLKKKQKSSEQFRHCNSSLFLSKSQQTNEALSMDWFVVSALRYQLTGKPFSELCLQNAEVAANLNRPQVAQTWRMINQLFSGCNTRTSTFSGTSVGATVNLGSANASEDKMDNLDLRGHSRHTSGSVVNGRSVNGNRTVPPVVNPIIAIGSVGPDLTSAQTEEDSDSSAVETIFTPTSKTSRYDDKSLQYGEFFFSETDVVASRIVAAGDELAANETATVEGFVQYEQSQDWDLPKEAFQPRHPIQDMQIPVDIDGVNNYPSSPTSLDEDETAVEDLSTASTGTFIMDNFSKALLTTAVPPYPTWKFTNIIVDVLHFYAKQGDIQTTISIIIVLGERLKPSLNESLLEFWFQSYIDLLSRFELWNIVSRIICLSPIRSINMLNQTSTTVYSSCARCSKPVAGKVAWLCDKCKSSPSRCAICNAVCKGVYVWCQGCSHGGHIEHIENWFSENRLCPTGCGHLCEYT